MSLERRILISRTDSIGDVILTLPMARLIKDCYPDAYVGMLGKNYTRAIINCCSAIDEFVDIDFFLNESAPSKWDTIVHVFPRRDIAWHAKKLAINKRIGTTNRIYHWLTCNRLVKLSRRNSNLHEAQLNVKLLRPLNIEMQPSLELLGKKMSFDKIPPLPDDVQSLIEQGKQHVILHPKSQGSAREWGLDSFSSLVRLLPQERFQIFISGTAAERGLMDPLFEAVGHLVTDITGKMDLSTFIAFINACDALVAASTGPLHIAAALGKRAIGIYPAIRPMHAGRWGPLGRDSIALALNKACNECRKLPETCHCIKEISAAEVALLLDTSKG